MAALKLGFKAFDAHELLCHFVARHAGLYVRYGLDVKLVDTTFMADDQMPPDLVQVACGAALTGWLRGIPQCIVCVATDRPLFWLYGRSAHGGLMALKGTRIAGFPSAAPPAQFLNVILREAGLVPDRDLSICATRDDTARLGLLTSGDVDAAVISSGVPPAEMERMGFSLICFFGDRLRIPTTGLAVSRSLLARERAVVQGLVSAHVQALAVIQQDASAVRAVLQGRFYIPERSVSPTCDLLRRSFTVDGRSPPQIASTAVALMSRAIGLSRARDDSPYDFSLLPPAGACGGAAAHSTNPS